jgi:hypothetical protein
MLSHDSDSLKQHLLIFHLPPLSCSPTPTHYFSPEKKNWIVFLFFIPSPPQILRLVGQQTTSYLCGMQKKMFSF